MPEIVGPHQSAFIRGRCLHGNFLLVRGIARKLRSLRNNAVMLKLDITKAFNTVGWRFCTRCWPNFGFGGRWLTIVCGLLGTASMRVVVNVVASGLIFNGVVCARETLFSPPRRYGYVTTPQCTPYVFFLRNSTDLLKIINSSIKRTQSNKNYK